MEIVTMFTAGLVMGAGVGRLVGLLRTSATLLSEVKLRPPVSHPVTAHG